MNINVLFSVAELHGAGLLTNEQVVNMLTEADDDC